MSSAAPDYQVVCLVTPPLSLESVRAELLDAAALYGFTDVSVGQDINRFGPCYWAAAYGTGNNSLSLANCLDYHTLDAMRAAALESLYALGSGCANL